MLLNPGRAGKRDPDPARSSGGFTGLVRHVFELSAVGELPLALDAGMIQGADEPVGCTIEYSLPGGQVLTTAATTRPLRVFERVTCTSKRLLIRDTVPWAVVACSR